MIFLFHIAQLRNIDEHFVAIIIGGNVSQRLRILFQRVAHPVGWRAADVGLGTSARLRLAVADTVCAEYSVHRELEPDAFHIAVSFSQHIAHLAGEFVLRLPVVPAFHVGVRFLVLMSDNFDYVKTHQDLW